MNLPARLRTPCTALPPVKNMRMERISKVLSRMRTGYCRLSVSGRVQQDNYSAGGSEGKGEICPASAAHVLASCAPDSPLPMPTLRPLPPQLIEPVARHADRAVLPALAPVSRIFHSETVRVLYRSVTLRDRTETSSFNRTICDQSSLARLVEVLEVQVESPSDELEVELHRLAHLSHLALAITPLLLSNLAQIQCDALESLALSSAQPLLLGQLDRISHTLRRQRRLTSLNLVFTTFFGMKIRAKDLPALASFTTRDHLTACNLSRSRPLSCVRIDTFLHHYELVRFLEVCPRSVTTLGVGLCQVVLYGVIEIAKVLRNLDVLLIEYNGQERLGDILQSMAVPQQSPPFGCLRLFSISSTKRDPYDGNLLDICSTILHKWRNSTTPTLERLTASTRGPLHTVHCDDPS